jgi:retron-type reverse transcriptase
VSIYHNSYYLPLPPEKEAAFFAQQRRAARRAKKPTTALDVAMIADVDNLAAVWEVMRKENGQAPGPDGIRFPDLGRHELYKALRRTRMAILAGTYRPGPAREVKIPKAGNRGFRNLTLRNLIDRVIAKAVNEAMVPFWENIFLDGSHGFRPDRSNWTLLANLERAVVGQGRWVLVSDDMKSAFPSVNIDRVVEDHMRHVTSKNLLDLTETILRGGDPDRKIGLDQGCPYMPAALNLHLHYALDMHAHTLGDDPEVPTPWFRHADNLVASCRDVQEGQRVLAGMKQRLAAVGLVLKGENGGRPVDLRQHGQSVQLLGFTLFRAERDLGIKLGAGAWKNLKKNLLKAHEKNRPGDAPELPLRDGSSPTARHSEGGKIAP